MMNGFMAGLGCAHGCHPGGHELKLYAAGQICSATRLQAYEGLGPGVAELTFVGDRRTGGHLHG